MTYEEWVKSVERGVTINPEMAFAAGAASRDAEVLRLKNELEDVIDCKYGEGPTALASVIIERDKLREQVKMLRDAIEYSGAADVCQELADVLLATEPRSTK